MKHVLTIVVLLAALAVVSEHPDLGRGAFILAKTVEIAVFAIAGNALAKYYPENDNAR